MKAVIFDLDGVITDTAEFHYIGWKYLADKLGIEIDREFNETLKGISRIESLEKILIKGNKQNDFTDLEKQELAKDKNDYYLTLLEKLTPKDILENIKETLIYLKEEGIKTAIASASKNAPLILDKLEVTNYFEIVVNPESVEKGKPAPDIFLEAARLLGVNPTECIGVEDSEAGVVSINDANMYSVGIGSIDNLNHANIVINDTSSLKETLEKIINN